MNLQFGDRLKKLRSEKDFSQTDLANHFNMGKSTISNYENNNRLPDINTICRFAEFFDVTLDYIMGKTDNRKHNAITINPPKHMENVLQQNIDIDKKTQKLFISRIKNKMVDEELTKATLSLKTGIDKNLISEYIDGEDLPDIKTLKKLATGLNTTTDYLLGINDNSSPNEITLIGNWVIFNDKNSKREVPTDIFRNFIKKYLDENPDK
jgi:transcriptional regulator with XRE-family HTH domain